MPAGSALPDLQTYQAELAPELDERGIRLIATRPQRPDGPLSMQQKHNLSFTVVSIQVTPWHE